MKKGKILKKIILIISSILAILFLGVLIDIYFEWDKIAIDRYNFEQLERVKFELEKYPPKTYTFRNIKNFNLQHSQNIQPIKNCYFLMNTSNFIGYNNGGPGYIFGFKLESTFYKIWYQVGQKGYYAYPKYDLPVSMLCDGMCEDVMYREFVNTISNPCKN